MVICCATRLAKDRDGKQATCRNHGRNVHARRKQLHLLAAASLALARRTTDATVITCTAGTTAAIVTALLHDAIGDTVAVVRGELEFATLLAVETETGSLFEKGDLASVDRQVPTHIPTAADRQQVCATTCHVLQLEMASAQTFDAEYAGVTCGTGRQRMTVVPLSHLAHGAVGKATAATPLRIGDAILAQSAIVRRHTLLHARCLCTLGYIGEKFGQ